MTVAIFALLIGLAGAYTVRQYLTRPAPAEAVVRPPAPQVISLASNDLSSGKTIAMGDIVVAPMTIEEIKRRKIPGDAMTSPTMLIGRILKNPITKGKPFLTSDLYPDGMGPTVAERLKPGFRAVTVPVTDIAAVSGFATPGSMVDVLFRAAAQEELPETGMTLVERVEVLAYGASVVTGMKEKSRGSTPANMVTLAVTPRQAAALQVVVGHGELSLALRNPDDPPLFADGVAPKLTLEQLLGLSRPSASRLEIYYGASRQTLKFDRSVLVDEQWDGQPLSPPNPAAPPAPQPEPDNAAGDPEVTTSRVRATPRGG